MELDSPCISALWMTAFSVEGGARLTEVLSGDEDRGGEGTDRVSHNA